MDIPSFSFQIPHYDRSLKTISEPLSGVGVFGGKAVQAVDGSAVAQNMYPRPM
jgi:hypothetical protein